MIVPGRGPWAFRWYVKWVSPARFYQSPGSRAIPSWLSRKARFSGRGRSGVIKALKCHTLQRCVEKPLKGGYLVSIVTGDKGKRISVFVNSSGTADAVDIGVCIFRHIVIDDVGNAQDIDTAGGDIGRHQNFDRTVTESFERRLTSLLGRNAAGSSTLACVKRALSRADCSARTCRS
mgnify:CR=1 FL=1